VELARHAVLLPVFFNAVDRLFGTILRTKLAPKLLRIPNQQLLEDLRVVWTQRQHLKAVLLHPNGNKSL